MNELYKIKLKKYLDKYLNKPKKFKRKQAKSLDYEELTFEKAARSANINDYIKENKEDNTFQTKLFKYIDDCNLKDSDIYNKANIDRRLFSKIRSNINYHPSKETIILLGLALKLNENQIEDLLESASYSLPKNTVYDLIIRFCFKEKIYDIIKVNNLLYEHECKTLN